VNLEGQLLDQESLRAVTGKTAGQNVLRTTVRRNEHRARASWAIDPNGAQEEYA
jgi:hypothetical protein